MIFLLENKMASYVLLKITASQIKHRLCMKIDESTLQIVFLLLDLYRGEL